MTETSPEAPQKTWRCLDCRALVRTPADQTERPPCRKDPTHKRCVPQKSENQGEDPLAARLLRLSRELTAAKQALQAAEAQAQTAEAQAQAARAGELEAGVLQRHAEERAAQAQAIVSGLEAERDAAQQELASVRALMTEGERSALARLEQAEVAQERLHAEAEALEASLAEVREARLSEQTRLLALVARWRLAFWALAGASALSHVLLLIFR